MAALRALAMLLAGLAWNDAWKWAPEVHQGRVYTAGSGLFIAALLAGIAWRASLPERAVCVLLGAYALQVFACNAWFIVDPWPVRPGDELCSSRLHFPLGLTGLWAATMVAQWVYMGRKHG